MTTAPSPERGRVAFLGLGTMGEAMAANLARAGFTVTGWNRTAGRAAGLADLGVTMAETPAEAVAEAGIAVVCVSDTPDVEAVLFGPDGVVEGARPGHAHRRLLDDRPVGELGLRGAVDGARPAHGRRARSRAAARAPATRP